MNDVIRKLMPWLPLAIAVAYFAFLAATWARFLRTQAEVKSRVDEALDSWLATQAKPAE